MSIIYGLLLTLDGAIYNLIDYVYDIFDFLAKTNIFSQSDYQVIVDRIFIILGLVMLFVLAYSLLKAVINPDEYAKGENSFANIIKNVIISLIIIIILPTVFTVAFNIQNSILGNDTLGKLILGTNGVNSEGSQYADAGRTMAFNVFSSFFYPDAVYCLGNAADSEDDVDFDRGYAGYLSDDELYTCKELITTSNVTWWWPFSWGSRDYTFNQIDERVQLGASFTTYSQFNDEVSQGKINYTVLVSTVAGIFLLYVLLNFCFDMAVRVIKLAFYQIIAPIPVVCRILPGEKMKGVFSEWVKQIISLFFEVFVRIAIMYLGIFIINLIVDNFDTLPGLSSLGLSQRMIARALLIMGVVIFIRQAPQLIGKMLNIDTGGMKLGLMDKLAMGGGLLAGAAVGGGITSAFKNYNMTRAQGGGRLAAIKSAIGGAGSGALRSGYNAKSAKNFKDMAGATSKGIQGAVARKGKRDAYKASHSNETVFGHNIGAIPLIGGALSTGVGHLKDAKGKIGETFGFSAGLDALNTEKAVADEMNGFYKTMASYVEDNEMVANYAGLYDAEMKKEISSTVFDSNKYQEAVNARMAMYRSDNRYSSMNDDTLRALASSEIDKNQFTRERTVEEMAIAIEDRQQRLKMYDNLKKMATIKAINKKLNDKNADGSIKDGRFQAVVNQAEVFKKQNSTYDFVQNMKSISGVQWDSNWDEAMKSGDANRIDNLMDQLKTDQGMVGFFADSETAKNRSGAVSAEIAKKIQEKKSQEGK